MNKKKTNFFILLSPRCVTIREYFVLLFLSAIYYYNTLKYCYYILPLHKTGHSNRMLDSQIIFYHPHI